MTTTTSDSTDDVINRFAVLKPELVRSYESADVVKVDSSSMFQGLHKHLLLVTVGWPHVEQALVQHKHWLTKLVGECMEESPVVPLVMRNRDAGKSAEAVRNSAVELLKGQPLISSQELEQTDRSQAKELLRRAIIQSPSNYKLNPFKVHATAVSGMFFGRNDELHELQAKQGHFFIVGARRIGKTSLVTKLVETTNHEQRHVKVKIGDFFLDKKAVLVDVSSLGQDTSKMIWAKILEGFGIDKNRWRLYSRKNYHKRMKPTEDPAYALQTLLDGSKGKLTIVLDEMDGWIKREAISAWQTIDRLRALTDDGRAKLVLVGYELLRVALQNDKFPLYERGTRITLGPIDNTTLKQLVTRPLSEFGIETQGEEVITKIWKKTGGMPHIVQDICNILLDDCLKDNRHVLQTRHVSSAIGRSQKYKVFIRGAINCGFPLAEAIAGIIACKSRDSSVEVKDVAGALKSFGYVFDGDEFELAINYLELRLTIDCADNYRTSWRIFNEGQREYMYQNISNIGFENWLSDLIKKHKQGLWRKSYEGLL